MKKLMNWVTYLWTRYVMRYDALIRISIRDGDLRTSTQINKRANDNGKLVFWAMKGAINDLMKKAQSQNNVGVFIGLAVAGLNDEERVPSFAVPSVLLKAQESAEQLRQAGVVPPCSADVANACANVDGCQTCLQNPHLPKEEVTLGELVKGAKF